ncbi:MAG: hypothetical protein CM1200mP2_32570 [Planctomycetaceae bacterium]|nr:MAG: hypothetical protein CM1200mP2_32570 [Planctomycetaceae bacterium]
MWRIVRSDHTRRLRLSRLGRCVIVYAVAHPVAPPSSRDRSRAHYSSEPADDHSSTRCCRRRSFELSVAGHHPAGRCRRFPRISRSQTGQHFDRNRIAQAMAQGRPQAAVDSQGHRRRLLDGQRRRWPRLHDGGDEGGRRERARDRSGRRQHRLVKPKISTSYNASVGNGPRGTPSIDGKRLYAQGLNGDVACLDLESGKILWQKNVLKTFKGGRPGWAICESVLIDGQKMICTPGGRGATMVALDKLTGDELWRSPVPGNPGRPTRRRSSPPSEGFGSTSTSLAMRSSVSEPTTGPSSGNSRDRPTARPTVPAR